MQIGVGQELIKLSCLHEAFRNEPFIHRASEVFSPSNILEKREAFRVFVKRQDFTKYFFCRLMNVNA